ncbi:hypothetical protein H5410_054109 [Solanum commersonii]|uniref:Uncharacterized protein n=1 Tax=Solanum commersonii TaxID=4109 RepID=A0A9J5X6I1_SOLCO|nr:hypothetical protein H5410_054109 [Solanum commersonii]
MAQYTCVDDTLKCFEWLENYRKLTDPATINVVKMYLRFMKTFLVSAEKLPSTEEDTYLISYVQDWVQNAGKTIQLLCANAVEESKVTEAWHGKIEDLTSKITTSYRFVLQLDATMSNICLVELIDSVSNNLNDLLGHKTKSIQDSIKKKINILQVKFRFLWNFAWFSSRSCIEHHKLEDALRIIEVVATTIACLLFQCLFEDMDTIMETKFSQVLLTIQLIEPDLRYAYFRSLKFLSSRLESSSPMEIEVAIRFLCCFRNDLKELLRPKAYLMASARDNVCNLSEELNFLIAFLIDPPKIDDRKNAKDLLARPKAVVKKTAHVIHLLLVSIKNKDAASTGDDPYLLFDLLEEIDLIKKEIITDNYLDLWKSIRSNLIPKVNSLGLIDFLLETINVVLDNKTDSVDFIRHQLEIVKAELVSLRSLLRVNDLEMEVTDVVHEVKHAISAFIIRESPRWHCSLQLSNVIVKIQDVNNKVAARFVRDQIVKIGASEKE